MRPLILAAAVISGACGGGGSVGGPSEDGTKVSTGLLQIEDVDVEVRVRESSPPMLVAHVRGFLPDTCWTQAGIEQRVAGNVVSVFIITRRPLVAQCAQQIVPVEMDIVIGQRFEPGRYSVRVNGVQRDVEI